MLVYDFCWTVILCLFSDGSAGLLFVLFVFRWVCWTVVCSMFVFRRVCWTVCSVFVFRWVCGTVILCCFQTGLRDCCLFCVCFQRGLLDCCVFCVCFQTGLRNAGFKRVEELQSAVDKLTLNVHRAQAKILGIEPPPLETEVWTAKW